MTETIAPPADSPVASKEMPGRQLHIQDCVDQILAKVDARPAAG